MSRQAYKIKHLEKQSDLDFTRLRELEEELQTANASLEEHERMDYGQLARKLGDKPQELLPHLLKRMLQERIAAVTLLKAVQGMENDLLQLCRLPVRTEAEKQKDVDMSEAHSPFIAEQGYTASIKRATSALVGYRVMPIQSYSIIRRFEPKDTESPQTAGSGRAAAAAASTVASGTRSTFSGLQPRRGLANMPPHIQSAGGYNELLQSATAVDTMDAMKAISYQMNTEYLHHAEKVEGLHHLVQARILFGDRWDEHWDTYERMEYTDRSRLENAARKLNKEFLKHQNAANNFNDRLGQLLQARDKVALDNIEKHYMERIMADNAASSSMIQWAEHQSKVLKQSELAPIRTSTGTAPAFASLREYRKRAGKLSRSWGLTPMA
jgi:hypothetical protein